MESEQDRFVRLAYARTVAAARKAVRSWHARKQEDAIQKCLAKMWDSYSRLLQRGKTPKTMISGLVKYAILWVRYDRKIGGRSRRPDVYDYRSGFARQMLCDRGQATPTGRSSAENSWIDWTLSDGDDPADMVMATEGTGLSLAGYYAA